MFSSPFQQLIFYCQQDLKTFEILLFFEKKKNQMF